MWRLIWACMFAYDPFTSFQVRIELSQGLTQSHNAAVFVICSFPSPIL